MLLLQVPQESTECSFLDRGNAFSFSFQYEIKIKATDAMSNSFVAGPAVEVLLRRPDIALTIGEQDIYKSHSITSLLVSLTFVPD
jgi:hypothetical protein